jgi:hypothetical protein
MTLFVIEHLRVCIYLSAVCYHGLSDNITHLVKYPHGIIGGLNPYYYVENTLTLNYFFNNILCRYHAIYIALYLTKYLPYYTNLTI